jgi:STE24 endopeptidase
MAIENILITEEEKINMIPYKTYILIIMFLIQIFEIYIKYRQYRRLGESRPIPKELISLGLDKLKYEESQKYQLAKIKFKIILNITKNAMSLLFLYFDLNPLQYNISRKLCTSIPLIKFNPDNEYGPLFYFIFFELISEEIIDLPFELYETFVLEEKFGFNKTTLNTFIKDQIKTFILFLIIIPIVISLLVYVIIKGGKYFYIFTEICAIILMFIFMWVYPNIIQPLFNKFKELEEGDLKTGIMDLAKRVNYPLKKIYEMDASQRSSHSNAYLFGFWKNKRIVLFDTLIKNLEIKEIEGVLGHEFGHWAKWHSIILLFISFTNIFIIFYLLQFFINEIPIFISFGFEQKSVFIGLYLFFLIYSPVTFFINAIQNYIVRIIEYQADKYSYELGYGDYLKKALIKLSESNKSDLDPDPLYSIINYSHPILVERIRAINKYQNDKKEN